MTPRQIGLFISLGRAAAAGRDPDRIKVLFLAYPSVDSTMKAAREWRRLERIEAEKHVDMHLSGMLRRTGIDFSKVDLMEF
jgi:long-chain alkane monooxygenase